MNHVSGSLARLPVNYCMLDCVLDHDMSSGARVQDCPSSCSPFSSFPTLHCGATLVLLTAKKPSHWKILLQGKKKNIYAVQILRAPC